MCAFQQRSLTSTHVANAVRQNIETLAQILLRNRQWTEAFHDLGISATGFDDQSALECAASDSLRQLTIVTCDALHHAETFVLSDNGGKVRGHRCERITENLRLVANTVGKGCIRPIFPQRGGCRNKRVIVAAKRAVVLARLPLIVLLADQRHRKRQAVATQRL